MEIKYPVSAVGPVRVYAFPVAAGAVIQKGRIVCCNHNGFAVPAADAPGYVVVGVAKHSVDNSGGGNGDEWITVYRKGLFEFDAVSITQAMVRTSMYVIDDHTIDDAAGQSYFVRVGSLMRFISATRGVVSIIDY